MAPFVATFGILSVANFGTLYLTIYTVKQESFDAYLPTAIEALDDPKYVELYKAFLETQENYTFYTMPQVDTYLDLETRFEKGVRLQLTSGRREYLDSGEDPAVLDQLIQDCYQNFKNTYQK